MGEDRDLHSTAFCRIPQRSSSHQQLSAGRGHQDERRAVRAGNDQRTGPKAVRFLIRPRTPTNTLH